MSSIQIILLLSLITATTSIWKCEDSDETPCYPETKSCKCLDQYSSCCLPFSRPCKPRTIFNAVAAVSYNDGKIIYFKQVRNETGHLVPGVEKRNIEANFRAQTGLTRKPRAFANLKLQKYDDWSLSNETRGILEAAQGTLCGLSDRNSYWTEGLNRGFKAELFNMDFTPRFPTVRFMSPSYLGFSQEEIVFQVTLVNKTCGYRIDTDLFYHYATDYPYVLGMERGVGIQIGLLQRITMHDLKYSINFDRDLYFENVM